MSYDTVYSCFLPPGHHFIDVGTVLDEVLDPDLENGTDESVEAYLLEAGLLSPAKDNGRSDIQHWMIHSLSIECESGLTIQSGISHGDRLAFSLLLNL